MSFLHADHIEIKNSRVQFCQQLLSHYENEGNLLTALWWRQYLASSLWAKHQSMEYHKVSFMKKKQDPGFITKAHGCRAF